MYYSEVKFAISGPSARSPIKPSKVLKWTTGFLEAL